MGDTSKWTTKFALLSSKSSHNFLSKISQTPPNQVLILVVVSWPTNS
jgi:hypothetical protein